MVISVASGKGGTGKTTVATNLAYALGSSVNILDCDVEEPNAHLFLKPEIEEEKKVLTDIPEIDEAKCNSCRKCMEICRFRAITIIGDKVLTFPELCHSCGGCMEVCPEDAIKWAGRELGVTEKGKVDGIDFIHGKLRIGEAMAPPLIRNVRTYIDENKINIIDAPPGTSCPVITAMNNTDFVLMVTEPTPFGLHDLVLAVEAVKLLHIPCGLVINRAGIGNDDVKIYADKENIPVLMEIPFDRSIAEAYSRGKLFVAEFPGWKEKFLRLYSDIEELVKRGTVNP